MNKKQLAVMATLAALGVSSASAQTFDPTTFDTILTSGVTSAATIAGAIAAVSAGVMAWKKIRKYFGSAG